MRDMTMRIYRHPATRRGGYKAISLDSQPTYSTHSGTMITDYIKCHVCSSDGLSPC